MIFEFVKYARKCEHNTVSISQSATVAPVSFNLAIRNFISSDLLTTVLFTVAHILSLAVL